MDHQSHSESRHSGKPRSPDHITLLEAGALEQSTSVRDRSDLSVRSHGGGTSERGTLYRADQENSLLQGPVYEENLLMMAFFVAVVASTEFFAWAPNVRFANFVPYMTTCWSLLEACRILRIWRPAAFIDVQLFGSLVPFGMVLIYSREAHIMVALMFFPFSLIVYMQTGQADLQARVMLFIVLFTFEYSVIVMFMMYFYVDVTGTSTVFGRVLNPPLQWGQEASVLLAVMLLGVGFLMLESFIKLYSRVLVESSQHIKNLNIERQQLLDEIDKLREDSKEAEIDLESPMAKMIAIIQHVAETYDLSPKDKGKMAYVVRTLASGDLYAPVIDDKQLNKVDDDTSNWLNDMLHNEGTRPGRQMRGSQAVIANNLRSSRAIPVVGMLPPITSSGVVLLDTLPNTLLDESALNELNSLLSNVEQWGFDVFEVARQSHEHPLYFTAMHLFRSHDLFSKLGVDETKMKHLLVVIERGYKHTPYHNSTHATDVLQSLNWFLLQPGMKNHLSDLDIFAALIAAIIHDYEHPGMNNAYHVNTMHEFAMLYNDKSVLENMHLSHAFQQMMQPQLSIFESFTEGQRKEIRDIIINMVLSTDMAQHFEMVGKMNSKIAGGGIDLAQKSDRILAMQMAMKCADVSNPAKPSELSTQWTERVMSEFYLQGDAERRAGLPISAFMDREKPAVPKCQLGFIDFIVGPLFDVFTKFLPEAAKCNEFIDHNRVYWKARV